ncbi:MAG: hypothetical protein A2W99_15070 [Bacteroidetes bacterium GWF2_33_16]|nr:MAG: hypothetical protein A2X00_00015 [Bacteroidetes bacterium GWE2_32_14]OFY07647.1 MAG: hypothetical protein A2W99_15070 [Bacteroidetes bacterium GWF2_33_16]
MVNTGTGFVLKSAVVVCFAMLLFLQNISAQVISNSGAAINLTGGVVVQTDTVVNQAGLITNNGVFNLTGDYRNAATTGGNGYFNLAGNWINTGVFNSGASTVQFNGNNLQTITRAGGETFHNLVINNSGIALNNRIVLPQNVTVAGTLSMALGNIDPGTNTLYLTNPLPGALNYTSSTGSRVLGKFDRRVNSAGNYLFPLGTTSYYNPLNLNTNVTPTTGSVLSEFIAADPGSNGLPLTDLTFADSVEVYEAYNDGYWNLVSNSFSVSSFNISINGNGFTPAIQDMTRVIKRTNGGNWALDGVHIDASGTTGQRNNISTNISSSGTQLALALGRPRIWTHPADTAVCNGESASFSVYATGRGTLTYQWQINTGSGWAILPNGGVYSGATTKTLQLSSTNLAMSGYQYRVRITDARGNFIISNAGTLTVNPIPVALGTPQVDTLCDYGTTNILITSDVPGSTFEIEVIRTGNISGTSTSLTGGNLILHTLHNPTDIYDYVEYRIIPTGPFSTYCVGTADTVRIYVNPTPRAIATVFRDTICNDTYDQITLSSPSVFTTGVITFNYTSVTTGGITGNSAAINRPNPYIFQDLLNNPTALPASPEIVTYTVTPLAPLGCSAGPVATAVVTVHPTPDTHFDFTNNNTEDSVTCYLDSDAYATVIAQNGVNQFTYLWDDPSSQSTQKATGLSKGTYIVTITDNQGCITKDTIDIKQPDRLTPHLDSLKSVTCFGYADGYLEVVPTGGNGGFEYFWSTGETTNFAKDLSGDIYDVLITDYKGCWQDTSFYVGEPNELSASVFPVAVTCYGFENGSATAFAPGASNFLWNTGQTTAKIEHLKPGLYTVSITDASGCVIPNKSTLITQPDTMVVTSTSTIISCAGDADGTIDIAINGGNGTYSYLWSNGATTQDLLGLSGGQYIVTVTDWKGCVARDTATVNEPPLFLSDIVKSDITCYGRNDGTLSVSSWGGNGDHTYLWSTGDTITDITELPAGTYTITISDEKNCKIYNSAEIIEPEEMLAIINKTDIQCFGYADGTAFVNVSGGNGVYSVLWSNSSTNDTITGLSQGTYSVNIVDSRGCTASNSIDINEPSAIEINLQKTNITCFGFSNGQISVAPNGGISPYTYSWSHDTLITESSLNDLGPGPYTIYVTDNNNCQQVSSIEITQPDPLIATIDKKDITCFGYHNGSIGIQMYGGTPSYNYNWSDGNTSSFESFLGKGLYSINITDAQDCILDTVVEVIEPEILAIDPVINRSSCPDMQDGFIELNVTGGIGLYSIYWSNGSTDEDLYSIRSGRYTVYIYDENSCGLERNIILQSGKDYCVDIPSAFSPNGDGINDVWKIKDMEELYPNADIEVFDRSGKRVFFSRGYGESKYWDGTFNGKALPMDSYFYIIYLKNGLGRISGTVTIIR